MRKLLQPPRNPSELIFEREEGLETKELRADNNCSEYFGLQDADGFKFCPGQSKNPNAFWCHGEKKR